MMMIYVLEPLLLATLVRYFKVLKIHMSHVWIIEDFELKALYVPVDVRLFSLRETLEMCFYDDAMKYMRNNDNAICI